MVCGVLGESSDAVNIPHSVGGNYCFIAVHFKLGYYKAGVKVYISNKIAFVFEIGDVSYTHCIYLNQF